MGNEGDMRAFELRAGPFTNGELRVLRFEGREALSQPFRFDVDLVGESEEPVDIRAVLDGDVVLTMRSPGGERHVHGMVSRAAALGMEGGRPHYRVRIVPKLWRLGLTQRSRHFQGKDATQIVQTVLDAGGVKVRKALSGSYPTRDLCVQYRESDLAFVSRLLEDEGIYYFFEHDEDGHTLVLADAPNVPVDLPDGATLPFRERARNVDVDHVFGFEGSLAVQTGAVARGGFDFVRPTLDMTGVVKGDEDVDLEDSDHPEEHASPGDGKRQAKLRLEAHRAEVATGRGDSVCARLAPGYKFDLDEHEQAGFNASYQIVEVVHRGVEPELLPSASAAEADSDAVGADERPIPYQNRFRCMPAELPYRPPLATPRPRIPGVQTAVVVGPAGEEIHTDEHGRIKVQFHWDREGKKDDKSSAWVRVSQAWAGASWGALYIPRIGMEVILRFLEGNPDRPIVVGCTYNGANPPPIGLPGEKTKSTLRSSSSLGGSGSNELQFEDAAGSEVVMLHAQKDEKIAVENDKDQTIGGNEVLTVSKNRDIKVTGEQQLQVKLDDDSTIGGNQKITVTGNRGVTVLGNHKEGVEGNDHTGVLLARKIDVGTVGTETITIGKALTIGGAYIIDVMGGYSQLVGGAKTTLVKSKISETVGKFKKEIIALGNKTENISVGGLDVDVGKDYRRGVEKNQKIEAGRNQVIQVEKGAAHAAGKVKIEAKELGIVVNGEVVMIINKAGTVKIFGKNITIEASSGSKIKGKKVKKVGKGKSASKRLNEVLGPADATSLGPGSGKNPMLSEADVKGFKDGKYTQKVLKKDVVGYRLHHGGPGGYAEGKWITMKRVPPGLEGKLRCAIDPSWTNECTQVARIKIPAGTRVFEGEFAAQSGAYVGQGKQLAVAVPEHLRGKAVVDYLASIGVVPL